jgi:signal transduction histidine kinase
MSSSTDSSSSIAEAVLRDAPVALLVHDAATGACVLVSGAVERIVGQASGALARVPLGAGAWWKPAAVIAAMEAAIARGEELTHLQETVSPSGKAVVLSYRMRPVLHDGRVLLVTRLEDVTHRGDDRDWRHAAERMEAIGRVAGDIAHEFGNLLTVILSFASLVYQSLPDDDPNRADLAEVVGAAEAAAGLAQQFTLLRRSRSRGREPVDLGVLVQDVSVFLARLAAPRARVVATTDDGPLVALADRADAEYALINAVLHAKELVDEGQTLSLAVRRREGGCDTTDEVAIALTLPVPARGATPLADPTEFVHAGPAYAARHGSGYSLAERVARECGGHFQVRGAGAQVVEFVFPVASVPHT